MLSLPVEALAVQMPQLHRGPLPRNCIVNALVTSQSSSTSLETSLELLAHAALYCNYLYKNRNQSSDLFILLSLAGHLACCKYAEMLGS